jgi:hypothetical protein
MGCCISFHAGKSASQDIAPFWSIERVQEEGNRVAQRRHRKLKNLLLDGNIWKGQDLS